MNVAVFLCPASQVKKLASPSYDIVLTPENAAHPKTYPTPYEKIVATTSEHVLESSVLRSEMKSLSKPLRELFGDDAEPIIRRGLYLSALKNELRLLIDAKRKMDSFAASSPVNVDVYYTYLAFPELFSPEHFVLEWCHCPRVARGKLSVVFKIFGILRGFRFSQRRP